MEVQEAEKRLDSLLAYAGIDMIDLHKIINERTLETGYEPTRIILPGVKILGLDVELSFNDSEVRVR